MRLTIDEVKEYLYQIKKLDRMINNKLNELEKWKSVCEYPNVPAYGMEKVQSSGGRMSFAVENYITVEGEIQEAIQDLMEVKRDVIGTIEKLPLPEYEVLYEKYVNFKEFQDIADQMDKSYSWTTSVHGRGLVSVRKILQDREKAGE
nr:MAG TPA: Protein of unknown function (DUF722) [Caudoviricetes sp.]